MKNIKCMAFLKDVNENNFRVHFYCTLGRHK